MNKCTYGKISSTFYIECLPSTKRTIRVIRNSECTVGCLRFNTIYGYQRMNQTNARSSNT